MRHGTVPIVAGFLFFATAMAAVVGVSLLFPGAWMDWLWALNKPAAASFRAPGKIAGVLLLGLGGATLAAGFGLLRGRKWAWWFAVVLFTVNGCGDVVGFVVTRDWLRSGTGIAVAAVFLVALTRPNVRRHFQRSA